MTWVPTYRCRGPPCNDLPDSQFRLVRVILAASRIATAARLLQATVPDGKVRRLGSGRFFQPHAGWTSRSFLEV